MTSIDYARTAISRNKLSLPAQLAIDEGYIHLGSRVMDFGCGMGGDVIRLRNMGIEADGYDRYVRLSGKYFYNKYPWYVYSVVMCTYVLNVIDTEWVRKCTAGIVQRSLDTYRHQDSIAIFTVRTPGELKRSKTDKWKPYNDGWLTSVNTFQKGISKGELANILYEVGFKETKLLRVSPTVMLAK